MIRYRTNRGLACQFVMSLLILVMGCTGDQPHNTGLAIYYFPLDQFPIGGVTYRYRNMRDTLADPEIWHYQKVAPRRMLSVNKDAEGHDLLYQYDRFTPTGVVTDSLILFFQDALEHKHRIPVKVIAPNRFPFDAVDSTKVWLTHLDWRQPKDSLHVVLERRRRYLGPVTWTYEGRSIPAVRFRTEDKLETEEVGWTNSAWTGEEIYAKGIGLVYYRRNIAEGMVLEFALETRKE